MEDEDVDGIMQFYYLCYLSTLSVSAVIYVGDC